MARRRKQPASESVKIPASANKYFGLYLAIAVTLVLAGIPFALGKYIELNSPGPFDSGAYTYSAKHLLDGARLGVDEQSSAQPGTLIANIIGVKLFGFSDTGPKVVQMLLQLAAGVFLFYTLRKIFGSVAAVLATTVAAIYLSAPLIAKFGNVKEQFMIALMLIAGCCFLLYEFTQKKHWLLLTGFFALQPFYFKATGISIVIAIVLYLIGSNLVTKKWKPLCHELLYFLGGYAAGFVVPLSLFLWQKQPGQLLNTFPAAALQVGLVLTLALTATVYGGGYLSRFIHLHDFKTVSRRIWIVGAVLILAVVVLSILLILLTPGVREGDIRSYIRSTPFVSVPQAVISSLWSKLAGAARLDSTYLTGAREAIDFSDLANKIGRYYMALKVPILLAIASIIAAAIAVILKRLRKTPLTVQSQVVWMPAVWWILDMAFVWVSPRSYEQYYLPLCASAAVLSGYLAWTWSRKLIMASNKLPMLATGFVSVILLVILAVPIFAGQKFSPDTGADYGGRRRGYAQSLQRVKADVPQPWQAVGDYVRTHSAEDDKIYVWGWVPGIYVQAQRMAPVPLASEGNMHVTKPAQLANQIRSLVSQLEQKPPKYIVDSRKIHIPWDRPPLELWPTIPPKLFGNETARFLQNNPQEITAYNEFFSNYLNVNVNADEAQRFQAMEPFRQFVMNNYKPVVLREFGQHRLYERSE